MKLYLLLFFFALFNFSCAQSLRAKSRSLAPINLSEVSSTSLTNTSIIDTVESTDISVDTTTSLPDEWESVDLDEFKNNSVLMDVHYYTLVYVHELATQATLFPGEVLSSDISKVSRRVSDGINYKIDSNLSCENGTTIDVSTLFYFDADTNSREMLNFTFSYNFISQDLVISNVTVGWTKEIGNFTVSMIPIGRAWGDQDISDLTPLYYNFDLNDFLAVGGYSSIPVDQVNTDESLSNFLLYGVQQTVANGIEYQYLVSQPSYNLVQIYSIYGQQNPDGSVQWYRGEVGIDNGAGSTAIISFEVAVQPNIQSIEVPTFGFQMINNVNSSN